MEKDQKKRLLTGQKKVSRCLDEGHGELLHWQSWLGEL